ncbi:histidine phosphatase family protein [Pseudomonas indica]|uniref:histidine phosphatase family protein n=1 Tax=Pseudomonas indica TaxID=137658 RepID=UPI003FD07A10
MHRTFVLFLALWLAPAWLQAAETDAWAALREGRALLILRHATAPGVGDPPNFRVDDCSTQRNLDEQGRREAQRWGVLLRSQWVERPRLYSSRWCRALDTAREMGLGAVEPLPLLDSLFAEREHRVERTLELRRAINGLPRGEPLVLITHQVNITTLTGEYPRSGEGLILALPLEADVRVLARISPP